MNPIRHSISVVLATATLVAVLASASCGGTKSSPTTPNGSGATGNGDTANGAGSDTANDSTASAGARLVAMVGEIADRVANAEDCDRFASALSAWTNRNKAEFEELVAEVKAAAEGGEASDQAAQMDAKIVEGYLAVVEAAAECGENEAAMRAYEAFNTTVEKATY